MNTIKAPAFPSAAGSAADHSRSNSPLTAHSLSAAPTAAGAPAAHSPIRLTDSSGPARLRSKFRRCAPSQMASSCLSPTRSTQRRQRIPCPTASRRIPTYTSSNTAVPKLTAQRPRLPRLMSRPVAGVRDFFWTNSKRATSTSCMRTACAPRRASRSFTPWPTTRSTIFRSAGSPSTVYHGRLIPNRPCRRLTLRLLRLDRPRNQRLHFRLANLSRELLAMPLPVWHAAKCDELRDRRPAHQLFGSFHFRIRIYVRKAHAL